MIVNTSPNSEIWGMPEETYLVFMHFSVLAGLIILPVFGFFLPVLMWNIGYRKSDLVRTDGKKIMNWVFTLIVGIVGSFVLCFLVIGCFILPVIYVVGIVFTLIDSIKALKEIEWEIPISIKFYK